MSGSNAAPEFRHARARRGHPRLSGRCQTKDVDGRNKSGHDDVRRNCSPRKRGRSFLQRRPLQRINPLLRRFLARRALVGVELGDKIVEREISLAARFGDQVPLDGLDRISRRADAGGEDVGEAVLRDRIVLQRRFVE
jgi:hypothetical protein